MYASHWKRAPGRASTAYRYDGSHCVVVEHPADLERTIHLYDVAHPPKGWTWTGASWMLGPWKVEADPHTPGRWCVLRGGERATTEAFRTADRARHWAEVRLDRSAGPRRGPKAGAKGAAPQQAADLPTNVILAQRLGLTPTDLADQLVRLATDLHAKGKLRVTGGKLFVYTGE